MRRRSVIGSIGMALCPAVAGCTALRRSTTDGSAGGVNPFDPDEELVGVTDEFVVRDAASLETDDPDRETLERVNAATVRFEPGTIRIDGTITDGEPGKTAELRNVQIDHAGFSLYVLVMTIDDPDPSATDCPRNVEYELTLEFEIPDDGPTHVRIAHNGRTVSEVER